MVIVSADATKAKLERLLVSGGRSYLTKPLDIERLLAVIDEVLGKG